MLDIAFIRSNPDAVKSNCKNRNVAVDVDRVIAIDDERRKLLSQIQTIQQKQNELSKEIPKEKDRKSTRLNSSHIPLSRMPSSA